MSRTANATYAMKIACLIWLAAEADHPFTCAECGRPIFSGQAVQFDHRQAVGRGGANGFKDLRPVHAARRSTVDGEGRPLDCHDRKTFRPRGGATTIGGDNYEAKKTDRLAEKHTFSKALTGKPRADRPARAWASRKLQSRPFPKVHRPMRRPA